MLRLALLEQADDPMSPDEEKMLQHFSQLYVALLQFRQLLLVKAVLDTMNNAVRCLHQSSHTASQQPEEP